MATRVRHDSLPQMDHDRERSHRAIVVGVDGSKHNRSAVDWAAHEADRSHRRLFVVIASGQFHVAVPGFPYGFVDSFDYREHLARIVNEAKGELDVGYPGLVVRPLVRLGSAVDALLAVGRDADQIVVGKRGKGAFSRLVVGSTCIAVAGRSPVPVVVVPDEWRPRDHTSRGIVIGVDPSRDHARPLEFAFTRARELGVPVHVVHALDVEPVVESAEPDVTRWASAAMRLIDDQLAGPRERFPDVGVFVEQVEDVAALALLDASQQAQVLVLGRPSQSDRLGGFPFGSVGRAVLHYSETPVAIIPTEH